MPSNPIVVAGATGHLGRSICNSLIDRGASVRAIVRPDSSSVSVDLLRRRGVEVVAADFADAAALRAACRGGTCVVSALSGLREVIVDAQSALLDAAVRAKVPRFIPSDYAIDFTKLPDGSNRNLDLRREFHERLDAAPIAATSILCGMFTHLLTGQAPVILFPLRRVVYWEDPDQLLDFTTLENAAEFTAAGAMDASTPRYLRIAGDQISARGLRAVASEVTHREFRLLRAGGLGRLKKIIRITRRLFPGDDVVYPPWQGMQYLHNMFGGVPKLDPLDNRRYPGIEWTSVWDVVAARGAKS